MSRPFLALLALGWCLAGLSGQAVAQSEASRAKCLDITHFGADPAGKDDASEALQAALRQADPHAICIHFPAGSYRFSRSPLIALQSGKGFETASVTIAGDGAGVTRLMPDPDVDGLILRLTGDQQSFHIRDLSILAANASATASGIAVHQDDAAMPNPAQSDLTGLSIHGVDAIGGAFRFARGVWLDRTSNVNLINDAIVGGPGASPYAQESRCLLVEGEAQSVPVQINIVASQINGCAEGIVYGNYVQGIQITASNFVGNGTAIHQPAGNRGNDQLAISASQFNSGLRNVHLEAPIDGVTITGSDFYLSSQGISSIEMPGVQFAIQGNTFIQLGKAHTMGLTVGRYLLDAGVVTGNSFNNFDIAIFLGAGSRRVNVQSNAYSNIVSSQVHNEGKGNILGGGSL